MELKRCDWARNDQEIDYHDREWGKPLHDDGQLFEMLILEGMQAGLSWRAILAKREAMRLAFDGFSPEIIVGYGEEKLEELMGNPGIIRNRLKLKSLVSNAKEFLRIQEEHGSFDRYLWSFVGGEPIVNRWERTEDIPATSEISDRMSKSMKREGFKFVGSTICYALMQSVGMVNDHLVSCPEYGACQSRD